MPTEELDGGRYAFYLELVDLADNTLNIVAGFYFCDQYGPGLLDAPELELREGYSAAPEALLEWWRGGKEREGAIIVLDPDGDTVAERYSFTGGRVVWGGYPAWTDSSESPLYLDSVRVTARRIHRSV